MVFLRKSLFRTAVLAAGFAFMGALSALPVRAVDDPCPALGKIMAERVNLIQHVQSYKDKKPTADEACSSFTKLAKSNSTAISALERDGAWCRAPDGSVDNLKAQQPQIESAKANACKVADEQKKAAANGGAAQRQPLGGTGDILGGPVKLPQGAL